VRRKNNPADFAEETGQPPAAPGGSGSTLGVVAIMAVLLLGILALILVAVRIRAWRRDRTAAELRRENEAKWAEAMARGRGEQPTR
jgi:peptidoglycan/LPS O-acetylase OafA/YrhL